MSILQNEPGAIPNPTSFCPRSVHKYPDVCIFEPKKKNPLPHLTVSFDWILQKIEFIGDIDTVQNYLEKWGKRVNFGNSVAKIARKSTRDSKDKWCDGGERKNWISLMRLLKFLLPEAATQVSVKCPKC